MLDLFSGRFGWGRAFAERGWEVVGVDLVEPPELPEGKISFWKIDVLGLHWINQSIGFESPDAWLGTFDFICASSPCEQFSVHGMKHFYPNPPYPEMGIRLFNHTRALCEASGVPYVMENVRAAQQFVGNASNHCGPFYLWGSGIPPLLPQGINKGMSRKAMGQREYKGLPGWGTKNDRVSKRLNGQGCASIAATIPAELANCVADYAERITSKLESEREPA